MNFKNSNKPTLLGGGANLSTHTIIHSIVGCEPLSFLIQGGDVVCLHS